MKNKVIKVTSLVVLLIALAVPTGNSSEISLEKKLTDLINSLNLRIPRQDAEKIAKSIVKLSYNHQGLYGKCEMPSEMLLSVALKESTLNRFAYNKKTKDIGIMQINEATAKRLGLNKARLVNDIHYNMSVGCYLLTYNKNKYSKKRPYWVGIYNTGIAFWNPSIISKAKRYDKDIKLKIKQLKQKYESLNKIVASR